MTVAPSILAICRQDCATPPPMPQINTVSPARTRARPVIIRHEVNAASENPAASAHGIAWGTRARLVAGTTTYSPTVPGTCSPSRA